MMVKSDGTNNKKKAQSNITENQDKEKKKQT